MQNTTTTLTLNAPPSRTRVSYLHYLNNFAEKIDTKDCFYEEVTEYQAVYHFFINLKPKSKQRKRLNRNTKREYIPKEYLEWQQKSKLLFQNQWRNRIPLSKVILIYCLHKGNEIEVDADNLLGSPIDSMVKSNILSNDNVKVSPTELTQWVKETQFPCVYIDVLVNKSDNPNHSKEILTIPFFDDINS